MSPWLIAALVLAVTAVSVVIMAAVWRADWNFLALDPDRAAGVFSFVGTSFAVLLAFIIFIAYNSYNDAALASEAEAQAVFEASTSSDAFSGQTRTDIQSGLICYGRAVIHQEWPLMDDEKRSDAVDRWDSFLRRKALSLDVSGDPGRNAVLSQLLEEEDVRADGRRGRLIEAKGVVTGPIWLVLGLGALITIGSVLFFKERRESQIVQAALMGVVAAMVSAGLILVWFLDHPYTGGNGSIEPTEMQWAVSEVQLEHPGLVPTCEPDGGSGPDSAA